MVECVWGLQQSQTYLMKFLLFSLCLTTTGFVVVLYHSPQKTIGGAVRKNQTGFLEIKQIGSFAAWMQ